MLEQGNLELILQRCCHSGEVWAKNHTICTGSSFDLVAQKDRLICQKSFRICCLRSHRQADCDSGKDAARTLRQCSELQHKSSEAFQDCCEGCSLGIQAGKTGTPCTFSSFSFGTLWDAAFVDCCENSNSVQGTSPVTGKSRCQLEKPCNQICEDLVQGFRCTCHPGFKLAVDQSTCEDINECSLGTHNCDTQSEICMNSIGGFECVTPATRRPFTCPEGFARNALTNTCDDINECLYSLCPPEKECINTVGSYICITRNISLVSPACRDGFRYESRTYRCIDIDECSEGISNCDGSREICQNSYGSYQCLDKPSRNKDCPAGFKWNANKDNCEDINECQENLHECTETDEVCRNTMGGYECDKKCPATMKFNAILNKCVVLDACAEGTHNCKPEESCISTADGFLCFSQVAGSDCPAGFKPIQGSDAATQSCVDVNECEEFPDLCEAAIETCINIVGSYYCKQHQEQKLELCSAGFKSDLNGHCIDVNECIEDLDHCNKTTHDCVNLNGSYECVVKPNTMTCPPGFRMDPSTGICADVNECLEGHKCLDGKEECINVAGGYRCQQLPGYRTCPSGRRLNASTNSCEDVDECAEGIHSCNPDNQNCINAIGSYRCVHKATCPYGYRWNRLGNKCDDINECLEGIDDCDRRSQSCVNTAGSFQCQSRVPQPTQSCGTGYTYDASQDSCIDINECLRQPCPSSQTCENTVGSYRCSCRLGYILDTITKECRDINECQLGLHSCVESQRCDNTIGSFTCVRTTSCGTGYTLNADTGNCEDNDECALNTHNCGSGFECYNQGGTFKCNRVKCPTGQKLLSDGTCKVVVCGRGMEADESGNCIDINECAINNVCRTNQRCLNTIGSYRCQNKMQCELGYELNEFGNQCLDIDECARRIDECSPQQTCRNRPGHYVCECPRGYALNAQRECEDVDECSRFRGQICSSISECINTQGSYTCKCNDGFKKAADDKNCIDIDECAESPNICPQTCNNMWGTFQCSCRQGYTLGPDNRSCQDIDECKMMEGRGNLCIGICNNIPGSYTCSCPSGYRLSSDKRTCQDIDECHEENVCNGQQEVCLNTRGGYKCNQIICPPNYIRDKEHKNRCKRAIKDCRRDDTECIKEPLSYSYNYITFVSNMRIPPSGQLDLFTMRGPRFHSTTVQFTLELKSARSTDRVTLATRDFFYLRRTSHNEAMVSLLKPIQGPQDVELDLVLKMYHNGLFGGMAIAKIFIFVTPYDF